MESSPPRIPDADLPSSPEPPAADGSSSPHDVSLSASAQHEESEDDAPDFDPSEFGDEGVTLDPGTYGETPGFGPVPEGHKSGYVALVGKPNAGKSTLLNAMLGRKLSIVTRKPQTTRQRVLGILSDEDFQAILLDTPGVIEPRYELQQAMMRSVDAAVRDADLLLFLHDATLERPDRRTLERIGERGPALLVLTKMDLIPQEQALPLVERYAEERAFEAVIPVSAEKDFNLDTLVQAMTARLPLGPPFYPKDQVSEQPERFFVAEIIREQVFEQFYQEVPYAVQVNVTSYEEPQEEGEKVFIDAEIVVERASQKGILIGKGGKALKKLGASARKNIEGFLQQYVYLQLHVKVREGWRDKPSQLRSYGYDA